MKTSLIPILGLVMLGIGIVGCDALPREPSTLEDCVIQALSRTSQSDKAIEYLVWACEKKFGEIEQEERGLLSAPQLGSITGRGSVQLGGTAFAGTLYNGNPDIRVHSINIKLEPRAESLGIPTRMYRVIVGLPPYSRDGFNVQIQPEGEEVEYGWSIVSAIGTRVPIPEETLEARTD